MKRLLSLGLLLALLGCQQRSQKTEQQELKKTLLEVEAKRNENEIQREKDRRHYQIQLENAKKGVITP